jgi:hypothetical protein
VGDGRGCLPLIGLAFLPHHPARWCVGLGGLVSVLGTCPGVRHCEAGKRCDKSSLNLFLRDVKQVYFAACVVRYQPSGCPCLSPSG